MYNPRYNLEILGSSLILKISGYDEIHVDDSVVEHKYVGISTKHLQFSQRQ